MCYASPPALARGRNTLPLRSNVELLDTRVLHDETELSDHLPISATLRFPAALVTAAPPPTP